MSLSDQNTIQRVECTSAGTIMRVNEDGTFSDIENCAPFEGCR